MSDKKVFSDEALRGQLQKLDDLPSQRAEIGVVATSSGDVGVKGEVSVDIGKPGGFDVVAEGSWMRRARGYIAGKLRWTPK